MTKFKLLFWAVVDSLGIFVYVTGVAFFLFNAQRIFNIGDGTDKFTDPLMMLLLFIISAVITGSLFLGRPAYLFLTGLRQEGIKLFFYTLACLIVVLFAVFVFRIMLK